MIRFLGVVFHLYVFIVFFRPFVGSSKGTRRGSFRICIVGSGFSNAMGIDQTSTSAIVLLFLYAFSRTGLYRRTLKAGLAFEAFRNDAKGMDGVEELSNTITTRTLCTCISKERSNESD